MKNNKGLVGTSVFTAITASLCCIVPILALMVGTGGVVSTFSWIEPFRPYLIGLTLLVLGFAWYQRLKPKSQSEIDCSCENEKPKFINSKGFLLLVTVFAGLMLAFPYYSHIFYSSSSTTKEVVFVEQSNVKEIKITIEGMTCTGCETHIESEVNKLDGILNIKADYEKASTVVKYDDTRVNIQKIETAILSIGYKIVK